MIHIEETEIPKHRKKAKKKSIKKSNHKHDFHIVGVENIFKIGGYGDKKYWVFLETECSICQLNKKDSKHLSQAELNELKGRLECEVVANE